MERIPKSVNLLLRQYRQLAVKSHDDHYTRHLQHWQFAIGQQSREQIAGKQCQLDFFPAVLPPPQTAVKRKKGLYLAFLQLSSDRFLVAGNCIHGDPSGFE
jgi:hypothetical protein